MRLQDAQIFQEKNGKKAGWDQHMFCSHLKYVYGCVAAMSSPAKIELIHESMKENQWGITE